LNTKPCGQVQVQYMTEKGIPGRRLTLQSVGTMCDSGITEGSITQRVAHVSPLETGQYQHFRIQLVEYLIGRVTPR